MRILSFWVRPDFDYTIRAGGDHLSSLDRMVLGPGDHFIMNPRRRIWLQDGRLISSPASPRKKTSIGEWSGDRSSFKEKLECSRQGDPMPRLRHSHLRRRC